MIRILFVDDEPNVLHALRRALRGTTNKWEARFAATAAEAIRMLGAERFDVVVADLQMPGVDGIQLLTIVRARWPGALRVLTTGSCDPMAAAKAIRVAHQLLAKPYTTESLQSTVDRAIGLRHLLQDAALADLLSGLDRLPTLPSNYANLTQALRDSSSSIQDIGKLIQCDAGLTARVLQLANSAFFALPRRVASPAEAASFLGVELLQSLVLATESFDTVSGNEGAAIHVAEVWSHSVEVAGRAREIGALLGCDRTAIENAFTAALMHEVGGLVLFQNRLAQYLACWGEIAVGGDRESVERRRFGTTTARLGGYVLATWGLPREVVTAVAFHGCPAASPDPRAGALAVLHLAHGTLPTPSRGGLDLGYVESIGLIDRLPEITRVLPRAVLSR